MRAAIYTLGCKVNQYETQAMEQELRRRGHELVDFEDSADAYIVNTCSVTAVSDKKSRQMIRRARRRSPGAVVAACGCYVQTHTDEAKTLGIDLIGGTGDRMAFLDLLEQEVRDRTPRVAVDDSLRRRSFEVLPAGGLAARTRAMLKVEDGCVNFCTYCIVPYVRGRERSRHPEEIEREARELVAAGYKDITLLGQNVDSYGRDLDEDVDFADLIRRLNAIPGDFVIRFMSSHPKDATEKLFRAMAECEKCAHQMHLPVQSGNDRVLHAMNRGYTREKYLAQVALARQYMPDLVLTTDIIVGFPGETDAEFDDTLSLIETVRYDAMFTFIYSPRVGTPAAKMPDPYTRAQKQVRFDALVAAANRISEEKHRAYEGSVQRVLVDGADGRGDHPLTARTKGGRLVHMRGDASLVGRFVDVKITGSNTWALYGEEV